MGIETVVMSTTDEIFIVVIAVALIGVAASIARYYFVAIIAALVGGGAIVIGLHGNLERLPAGGEATRVGRQEGPIEWSRLYINSAAASRPGNPAIISTLSIMGTNVSNEAIRLDDVYFLCGLDGIRLYAQIGRGGERYKIRDMSPLPPEALFFVLSSPLDPTYESVSPSEFLKTWVPISLVAKYNGATQKIDFDQQTVESALPKP